MSLQTRLFVSNLPDDTNENELRSAFSAYGEITNFDLKSKSTSQDSPKKFAFITLSASNCDVESCIKYFSNEDFKGNKLYVTRARESFLERLQKEREQAQKNEVEKKEHNEFTLQNNPVLKLNDKLNPRKRDLYNNNHLNGSNHNKIPKVNKIHEKNNKHDQFNNKLGESNSIHNKQVFNLPQIDKNKQDSEKKRLEAMKQKRQEFKKKQSIIKTGLIGVDKMPNKKVVFSDNEDIPQIIDTVKTQENKRNILFEDDGSGDEVNFDIKKQFEGIKGQKVLDLQSRYKSDKRFILDERFIDYDDKEQSENEEKPIEVNHTEEGHEQQIDERVKQLNILQDVLGVVINSNADVSKNNKKTKPKLGMLRFDPMHPEHAKFLAAVDETNQEAPKKSKKKKVQDKAKEETKIEQSEQQLEKVEVSKEQFYKISENLKEAISQPNTFSLRSLFAKDEEPTKEINDTNDDYITLETKNPKIKKNPLDPSERNPFVYDSSDSENEDNNSKNNLLKEDSVGKTEIKAVWRENLFFSTSDHRLKEGLDFFNNVYEKKGPKERRGLKSVMKKRIHNTERNNQMFKKKIGGRKKITKTHFSRKK